MNAWRAGFWCALAARDVEVEFETHGLPGLRQPCGVRSCSAFGPPSAVRCHRCCLDAEYRRQWPSALPVHTRIEDIV